MNMNTRMEAENYSPFLSNFWCDWRDDEMSLSELVYLSLRSDTIDSKWLSIPSAKQYSTRKQTGLY